MCVCLSAYAFRFVLFALRLVYVAIRVVQVWFRLRVASFTFRFVSFTSMSYLRLRFVSFAFRFMCVSFMLRVVYVLCCFYYAMLRLISRFVSCSSRLDLVTFRVVYVSPRFA